MSKKALIFQNLLYILFFVMVFVFFHRFTTQNTERIKERNLVYAEDAAQQTALRIDDQLDNAVDVIKAYAYFLDVTLKEPKVSERMIGGMEKNSPFDLVRYTDAEGQSFTSDGKVTNIADRAFFRLGMTGESGAGLILNSKVFNQPVVVFYAPVHYEDKIIGVVSGTYMAGAYLHDILETTYFNKPADVFLCTTSGEIIATSGYKRYKGNILKELVADGMIDQDTADKAQEVFKQAGQAGFICESGYKTDNLTIAHLPKYNYVLVQTFPKSVTHAMQESANQTGVELEVSLLALCASYAIWMLLRARRRRKRLEAENRELNDIISGMDTLFANRYAIVNLDDDTYEYLSDEDPTHVDLKRKGTYEEFVERHSLRIIDVSMQKRFFNFFKKQALADRLSRADSVVYECHVMRDGKEAWDNLNAICIERAGNDENSNGKEGTKGRPVRVLFVRQNVTDMKARELRAKKRISDMNRKERQYRLAVTANAICNYEFNVTKDLVDADAVRIVDGQKISMLEEKGLEAPCKASELLSLWGENVMAESRDEYARVISMEWLTKKFNEGEREIDIEYWSITPEGREICVRQAFYMTRDDLSGDIMAMTVARDITAQVKRQREQNKALHDAMMQAQHANEAKTTFLSNMSHDIRTPMNAIIGFATIAASHLDNRDQVRDCLQKVLSSSNHLLSLINDILDMSRIESGKMQLREQECNISELMHNLVNIIQPQVKAKRLQMFIDTFEVTNEDVITDPLKLNQIFINLLSNAVKYTPAGGIISFRIRQTPAFRHGYADYTFEVRDNGVGMSENFVKHIFEPFTRETSTTLSGIQGTGLGMAITKNIIDMLNGKISVTSEKGKGSVFTITLTLKLQSGKNNEEDIKGLQGLRALVVDDDFHVCDSVDKMLRKIGMRSEWTTSGREAAARAQIAYNDKDPYHTYIIDWQMPDLNGVETARRIRRLVGEDAPIIILTAYEWADIEEEAREAGVTAFCAKPLFMSDLRNALLSTHKLGASTEEETVTPDFGGKRVLLVDDVEMNRELAEFILTEAGFEVESAPDGSDAVEMVQRSPENYYDAILMDVQMPTMNGYEATRAIRALPREDVKTLPIIAMTANALEEDKSAALKCGMNSHIAKPIDIKNLFGVMESFFKGNAA